MKEEIQEYYVYVLYSKAFDRYYKGFNKDLQKRLIQHNKGETKSTKPYIPWEIVYYEKFDSKEKALAREKYLKSAAGRRFLKNVLLK